MAAFFIALSCAKHFVALRITMKTLEQRIADLIAPSLEATGLEVVQVKLVEGARRKTVQVLLENRETGHITLDECAGASHTISALLDVEDLIAGAFNLEVSSPGIDRPLVKRSDFERFLGFEAKVETALPVSGRRRFRGQMTALEDDTLTMRVDGEDYRLALGNIASARLVLSDALLQAQQGKGQEKKAETG